MDLKFPEEFHEKNTSSYCAAEPSIDMKVPSNVGRISNSVNLQTYQTDLVNGKFSISIEPIHKESKTNGMLEVSQQSSYQSMGTRRTSEDGYNWRKYGQKQVKGSECLRSYYKCTHPNCQVTKKVELSHDGQITEIIYKGGHTHSKPAPNPRATGGSSFSYDEISTTGEDNGTYVKGEAGSVWANFQSSATNMILGSDGRTDGLERTSSTSVMTKLLDPLSAQGISVDVFESAETPELSLTLASHNDEDNGTTQGSTLVGDDDEESESKRRYYLIWFVIMYILPTLA